MRGIGSTLRACASMAALAFAGVAGVHAQNKFTINGRLKLDGGGLDGAKVVVMKNGQRVRTLTSGLSKFALDLDLDADYILEFSKDGFVTKKLSFNTRAPVEAAANGFVPFEFAVNLFKQYEGVNTVVFNQPVGMIHFDSSVNDFNYDTDYTRSIQTALDKVMQEVVEKQEQEKEKDAEEARRKEAEEKARARAEADKAKAEAEAARAKARDEKAAADAARKEAERQAASAKAAADAARKEQERQEAEKRKAEAGMKKAAEAQQAAEARKRKEAAQAEAAARTAPATPAAASPALPAPRKPPAEPPPVPPSRPKTPSVAAAPASGSDERRGALPVEGGEASTVRMAAVNVDEAERPREQPVVHKVEREHELIVEPNAVITRIELDDGSRRIEYRRVAHKRGQVFYFKDGQACSKLVYETEALAEIR